MEFHHRDPCDKELGVGNMMTMSDARIEAEIAKCDVMCANCHREVEHYNEPPVADKYHAKAKKLVDEAKNMPCMNCGISFPAYVMDLHHRDPATKLFVLNQYDAHGIPAVRAEIAKCDVLCACCHRTRHNQRGE